MAPVALCAELGANFSEAALGNWGVALLWLVVCFALVFGNLGLATALSFIMLLIGNPGRILLRLSAVAFCALGVIITVGLLSVQERHNHPDSGFDKSVLSPYYFTFPALFFAFGLLYLLLGIGKASESPAIKSPGIAGTGP